MNVFCAFREAEKAFVVAQSCCGLQVSSESDLGLCVQMVSKSLARLQVLGHCTIATGGIQHVHP